MYHINETARKGFLTILALLLVWETRGLIVKTQGDTLSELVVHGEYHSWVFWGVTIGFLQWLFWHMCWRPSHGMALVGIGWLSVFIIAGIMLAAVLKFGFGWY